MAVYQDRSWCNEALVLDGNDYLSCTFQTCKLVFQGGALPKLQHCTFTDCSWQLDEAAQRTIRFLRGIYHSGPGGRELVEETLRQIRYVSLK